MQARHLPRHWLMTDERLGDGLWDALARLPRGSGVVFRHYATPPAERRRLFAAVARIARRRGLVLVRAGAQAMPLEGGVHNRGGPSGGIRTFAVHRRRDIVRARRAGADLIFASPVFATRSHPGARGLGPVRLGLMIRDAGLPVVALGGMDVRQARRLRALKLYGWAAIDAWVGRAGVP